MFRRCLLLLAAMLYSWSMSAQYSGGTGDGYASASISNANASPVIYHGGTNDGSSSVIVTLQNAGPSIYKGGINDGVAIASVINQNAVPSIYKGGNNDGYTSVSVTSQNAVPNIYTGGSNDGYSFISTTNQNAVPNIYTGGSNDGYARAISSAQNAGPGIYLGGMSDGWSSLTAINQNPSVILVLSLDLKVFIEGFYAGNNSMQPVLLNNSLSNDPAVSDSITIQLHDSQSPFSEVASVNTVVQANGKAIVSFPNTVLNHSCYIVVKHRNSIETWSKLPVTIGPVTTYDFTVTP